MTPSYLNAVLVKSNKVLRLAAMDTENGEDYRIHTGTRMSH